MAWETLENVCEKFLKNETLIQSVHFARFQKDMRQFMQISKCIV